MTKEQDEESKDVHQEVSSWSPGFRVGGSPSDLAMQEVDQDFVHWRKLWDEEHPARIRQYPRFCMGSQNQSHSKRISNDYFVHLEQTLYSLLVTISRYPPRTLRFGSKMADQTAANRRKPLWQIWFLP